MAIKTDNKKIEVLLESEIKALIEKVVICPFFKKNKNVIGLYKEIERESESELRYLIVLNEDSPLKRLEIRELIDNIEFENFEFNFIFIPKEVIGKFENITLVNYA